MFNKKKKIRYVPDEEIMLYNKAKQKTSDTYTLNDNEVSTSNNVKSNKTFKFFANLIPKKNDSKKTLTIKIISLVCAVALIASSVYLVTYFVDLGQQDAKINNIRNNYELKN